MSRVSIYVIYCDVENIPVYVGRTYNSHRERIRQHIGKKSNIGLWIKHRKENKIPFSVEEIDFFGENKNDSFSEKYLENFWISYFEYLGFKLINQCGKMYSKSTYDKVNVYKNKFTKTGPLTDEEIKDYIKDKRIPKEIRENAQNYLIKKNNNGN